MMYISVQYIICTLSCIVIHRSLVNAVINYRGKYVGCYAAVGHHCTRNKPDNKTRLGGAVVCCSISSALMCHQSSQHCLHDTTKPSARCLAAAAAALLGQPHVNSLLCQTLNRRKNPFAIQAKKSSQSTFTFTSSQAPFHQ